MTATADVPTLPGRVAAWWWAVVYLVTGLFLSAVQATLAILVLTGALTAPIAGVGLVLLVPGLWAARGLAALDRSRASLLGPVIPAPPWVPRPGWRFVTDPVAWRATAYHSLHGVWAFAAGIVAVVLLAVGAALTIVAPWWVIDAWPPGGDALSPRWFVFAAVVVAGPLLIALGLAVTRGTNAVSLALGRWLLGDDPQRRTGELTRRIADVERSRTETVDSVEAERRRIERDLHDGPQQRLVAIAMDLGMARAAFDSAVATDPDRLRAMLDRAHAHSKAAIVEMRQVARGIAPPILTDLGLVPALTALTSGLPIPVSLNVNVPAGESGRLDPSVEAIAYFCVSESLTNVVKHAQATRAEVRIDQRDPWLHLLISDDGIGGAQVGPTGAHAISGTGLAGLRQRVGAVDGTLDVASPDGGPTVIAITLPARPRRKS